MATTRPHDTAFAGTELDLVLGVFAAAQTLKARHHPVNSETVARRLRERIPAVDVPTEAIDQGLALFRERQSDKRAREVISQRLQLADMVAELEERERRLMDDWTYLLQALNDVEEKLHSCGVIVAGKALQRPLQ